jgi:hypothetical protein
MTRVHWRWNEKDFGFRFRSGGGKAKAEFYQASEPGAFYTVPAKHRKLTKERVDDLDRAQAPTSPRLVPMPWKDYDRDWDWITTPDEILLNFAGCLDREEIHRREDEGVARAMEFVAAIVERPESVALSSVVIQQIHAELMGSIYPFAGGWRTVALHKGHGPTKWPLPPGGIEPLMAVHGAGRVVSLPRSSRTTTQGLRVRRPGDGRAHRIASRSARATDARPSSSGTFC